MGQLLKTKSILKKKLEGAVIILISLFYYWKVYPINAKSNKCRTTFSNLPEFQCTIIFHRKFSNGFPTDFNGLRCAKTQLVFDCTKGQPIIMKNSKALQKKRKSFHSSPNSIPKWMALLTPSKMKSCQQKRSIKFPIVKRHTNSRQAR